MPEWSEVKIMSEYFNEIVENKTFINVRKSDVSKVKTDLKTNSWSLGFTLISETRGKEFMIKFCRKPECFKHFNNEVMVCNMGMSGHWQMVPSDKLPKHAHLIFDTNDGESLCLVDMRRFARWQWSDGWSIKRGPDPIKEFDSFVKNVRDNIDKKLFQKPIYEVLMNQQYFNGIGNYLRAEILYRIDENPFLSAKEYISKQPIIFELCKSIPLETYAIGGGQLKEWTNPFNMDKLTFGQWLKCYGKKDMANLVDKNSRKFWYDKKYNLSLSYE